jgi:predicted alpha/beta hydrolase
VAPQGVTAVDLRIPATDGVALAATAYEPPSATASNDLVIIASATAVKRGYYDRYARFLVDHGFRVLAFDFRGIGGSRPPRLKGFKASMREWGEKDLAGVIAWASERHRAARLFVVGHSAGGYLVGLAANNDRLTALVAVASQSGYWKLWDAPRKYLMASLWYVTMPVLTGACSYFPARRLGLGEDLPSGVALEWARWGRHPQFIVDRYGQPIREHFRKFRAPILAYSFDDDPYAPRRAVDALLTFYESAPRQRRHLTPRDLGVSAIGHFGFFKETFRPSLWLEAVEWLRGTS